MQWLWQRFERSLPRRKSLRSAGLVLCTFRISAMNILRGNMSRQGAELGCSEPTATLQRPTIRRPIIMDTGGNLATSLGAIALAGWRRVVRGALGGGWRAALPAGPGARARPRGRGPARTGGRRRRAVAQLAARSGRGPHCGRGCPVPLPRMNLLLPVVELVENAIQDAFESGAYARATVAESPGALPPAVFAEIVDRAWASRDDWTHISSPPNPLGFFVWGATFNFDNAQTPHEYGSEKGGWTSIAWLRSGLYFLPRWCSHETTGAVLPAAAPRRRRVPACPPVCGLAAAASRICSAAWGVGGPASSSAARWVRVPRAGSVTSADPASRPADLPRERDVRYPDQPARGSLSRRRRRDRLERHHRQRLQLLSDRTIGLIITHQPPYPSQPTPSGLLWWTPHPQKTAHETHY